MSPYIDACWHIAIRPHACIDVLCLMQCEPGWKLHLTSAISTHLQPMHAVSE